VRLMADQVYTMLRWRAALITLVCLVWFAGGYWLFSHATMVRSVPMGFLNVIVSSFFVLIYGMLALVPTRLTLTDEDFELRHWTARERIAWRDVEPLTLWGSGSTEMVVYSYLPGKLPAKLGLLHRINHRVGNFDGSLPGNLPIRNETLCAEMNARRAQVLPSPRSS
jgi:hypothetical protein